MKFPAKIRIAVTSIKGVCDVTHDSDGRVIIADGIEAEFLQILSTVLKFKYELIIPEDRQWGTKQPDGNWTGMIGLVQHKKPTWATIFWGFPHAFKWAMTISPSGRSDYFLLGSWIFGISFLSRSYTAVLLSFLTLALKDSVIRDAPALSKAISGGTYRCFTFRGAWITHALEASGKEATRLIGKAMDDNDWFIKPSIEGVGDLMDEGNTAVIAMKPFFADHFADRAAISEDYFFITQLALAVRRGFCCKEYLNRKINTIVAAGLYEKCSNHYNFRARLKLGQNRMQGFDHINPLSVQDLSGAFLLLSLGLSFSVVVFVLEILRIRLLK
ncbi:lig_chan-Glu_bd domain-containing protein [Trichonephila inaurata madagascariensis]|uniref:Lig_chan-Glu_bd domain-containing protein n=1 Tax=Trichonephila inaurata madagascariensis TaxID=2747483 RepID=A0A8X6XW44_9ARAC|nr:lig_chan-Glu_bd domain-containing protein [Trichonephila inaurata madagascariensis]